MPDNDFWIGQEQIPVDLSLLLTYSNDEDYWYAPEEYALRVYTVDTLNTNFARPCFALGERTSDPEMEDVSSAIEFGACSREVYIRRAGSDCRISRIRSPRREGCSHRTR